ncbi:uncharacterized protein LOC143649760 isoform X2 [Tamandua tetradactyla]|uniref:uncharacterized protein LOC143649760 isoform X2 n=1 Tax=Tamandua tetradactyla TaxID=48850 RepID=UPI004053E016
MAPTLLSPPGRRAPRQTRPAGTTATTTRTRPRPPRRGSRSGAKAPGRRAGSPVSGRSGLGSTAATARRPRAPATAGVSARVARDRAWREAGAITVGALGSKRLKRSRSATTPTGMRPSGARMSPVSGPRLSNGRGTAAARGRAPGSAEEPAWRHRPRHKALSAHDSLEKEVTEKEGEALGKEQDASRNHQPREPHCDVEASGKMGVGPVHALPSTSLQKVMEQPEDADNQQNVSRMSSQPSDPSTTAHTTVMLTGHPGESTVVPNL